MTENVTRAQSRSRARFRIAVPSWTMTGPKNITSPEAQPACREEFKRLLDAHLEPGDLHRTKLERQQQAAIRKIRAGLYGFSVSD